MIKLEMLFEEKALLEKDMKTTSDNIARLTNDLTQMKANLNALNGALQQTNKLISVCEKESEEKSNIKRNGCVRKTLNNILKIKSMMILKKTLQQKVHLILLTQ